MSSGSIAERQNRPEALMRARAVRCCYRDAARLRAARLTVSIALGTLGIILAAVIHRTTDWVAAAAGAWTLVAHGLLRPLERDRQDAGARTQELFDCDVFELPWNNALASRRPSAEDLHRWGGAAEQDELRNWYPDVSAARRPVDVLLCQLASVAWARQDHAAYARWLTGLAITAMAITLAVGLGLQFTLGEYLLRLGLPALPAALDLLDLADNSRQQSRRRGQIERHIEQILQDASRAETPPSLDTCREVQDAILASRRHPGVPQLYYRLTRNTSQAIMENAACERVQAMPAALRQ